MTERYCYVTDVSDAIEKLADALDPERKPPFKGDILDLLEWAAKDVLEMRAEVERLKTVPMRYRRMAFNAQLQDENNILRQHVKLLRDALEKVHGHGRLYNLFSCIGSDSYDPECADLNAQKCRELAEEALAATATKEN